jgi:hypothetical protein
MHFAEQYMMPWHALQVGLVVGSPFAQRAQLVCMLRAFSLKLQIFLCALLLCVLMGRCTILHARTRCDLQISCLAHLAAVQFFIAECTHCLSVGLSALDAFERVRCAHVGGAGTGADVLVGEWFGSLGRWRVLLGWQTKEAKAVELSCLLARSRNQYFKHVKGAIG